VVQENRRNYCHDKTLVTDRTELLVCSATD
jgi:hypothetical protein